MIIHANYATYKWEMVNKYSYRSPDYDDLAQDTTKANGVMEGYDLLRWITSLILDRDTWDVEFKDNGEDSGIIAISKFDENTGETEDITIKYKLFKNKISEKKC